MPDNRLRSTEDLIGHDVKFREGNYGVRVNGELYARNSGYWIERNNGEQVSVHIAPHVSIVISHQPKNCRLCKTEAAAEHHRIHI